ncbi:MAG: amidohydrolase [Burkholderiales bacterium]|nr:amidohydrolase [Burkholderiales bacterium]
MTITIYRARRILTMNPARPEATHVAVRDGRILGAGTLAELQGWGAHRLDERFADRVLMPGFVEGHSHLLEGTQWRFVYVGYFDREDPDGRVWPGARSIDAVVARLAEAARALPAPDAPLVAWGFDPIYFGGRRCERGDLDRVSDTRPVAVLHASMHIINANSPALARAGLLRADIDHPGVPLGADGLPTGELKGPDAMGALAPKVGFDRSVLAGDAQGLRAFARLCVRKGVTTATDLASPLPENAVAMMLEVTGEPDFPTRIVPLLRLQSQPVPDAIARVVALKARSTDRLRLGRLKAVLDGSIQGFSARLRWPGYFNGAPNGLWYLAPEQLQAAYVEALAHGVQVHTHTNGDEATEAALDALQAALARHPARDHRFTLQHCQLADAAQFRRIRALGACVNLFANHHFYWGDQHYQSTVGPERAERMNACATALASGVPLAIHSDAPVTPLGPLFTAWCAIERRTASGRVLGHAERIDRAAALRAITLGAAYTLGLDGEIGSIEAGKQADFAILADDPLEIAADRIREVRVDGVVQGGRVFLAADL